MGAGKGDTLTDLLGLKLVEALAEDAAQFGGGGVGGGLEARPVDDRQLLVDPSNIGICLAGKVVEYAEHALAGGNDLRAGGDELLVPEIQQGSRILMAAQTLQQRVALGDDAGVVLQKPQVAVIDLAEHQIHVAAPLRRGAGDEIDVVGGEEDRLDRADDLRCPARSAVGFELLAGDGLGSAAGALSDRHLDANRSTACIGVTLYPGKASGAVWLLPPGDQIAIGAGPERLGRCQRKDRLQHVRLADSVRTVQNRDPAIEPEVKGIIGPEMAQAQALEVQKPFILRCNYTSGRNEYAEKSNCQ